VTESGRLIVRWYVAEDAEELHTAVAADRDALRGFLPWIESTHRNVRESQRFIAHAAGYRAQTSADDFVMAIFDREDGRLVGGTGFHRIDPPQATAEIGYWIRPGLWGRGLATETAAALLDVGFREWGFRRLRLCCAGNNHASIRVIDKVGARLEAVERQERWLDSFGWVDSLSYAILADEWDPVARRGPGGSSLAP
jgi:RimJ/RimL family protein N-acetyltransferase